MKERNAADLLSDILTEAEYAIAFLGDMNRDSLELDPRTIRALVRCFEIIGEAARLTPQSLRDLTTEVPWQKMVGMRNRLAHDYIHTDLDILISATKHDLPRLILDVRRLRDVLVSETSGVQESQ